MDRRTDSGRGSLLFLAFTLIVGASLASAQNVLVVRPQQLTFQAVAGGTAPPPQWIVIGSNLGAALNWTASSSGGSWLKLGSTSGTAFNLLQVSVDPTGLAAGQYQGQVTIAGNGLTGSVGVTLTVAAAHAAELDVDPRVIVFESDADDASPLHQHTLHINNDGSGTIAWTAQVAVDSPSAGSSSTSWLAISASSGTTPSQIVVTANGTGLAPGAYTGHITVTGGGETAVSRVYFSVHGPDQPMVAVHPRVMRFNFFSGTATPVARKVYITSKASGLSYSASASTAKGGNWLNITPATGVISDSSFLTASINTSVAAGLAPGRYTGKIEVQTPGTAQTMHDVYVALKVFSAGESAELEIEPGTIGFMASVGGASPPAQTVNLEVTSTSTITWSATAGTDSGGSWLTATPLTGTGSAAITVTANTKGLTPGVYKGSVVVTPAAGSSANMVKLGVWLLVTATPSSGAVSPDAAEVITGLSGSFTEPGDGFVAEVNQPQSITVTVVDTNGVAVAGATVSVASSNGETTLVLADLGGGVYNGVFQPLTMGPIVLTGTATSATFTSPAFTVSGDIVGSTNQAILVYQGGAVSAASYAPSPTPLAVGSLISLFGRNLTVTGGAASSLPLPTSLGGVSVTVGGIPAPLVAADPASSQINLQIPFEVAGQSMADVMVNNGGVLSAPQTIMIASASPAIFTLSQDGTGPGAILHADYSTVGTASPAQAGEQVMLFATGLGQASTPVADGSASSSADPVPGTVTVTIGGQQAVVAYAGLAPNYAGLYQINVIMPSLPSGDQVIQIQVNGMSGTGQATIAIR